MVLAADSAEWAGAIGPSPFDASLHGVDEVNLLPAGALSGFGPYVAAFLAEQNWTQQNIGFVLTASGFAGLLSQLPGGALLDAIRSKRIAVAFGAGMVAAGALIVAIWPSFPLVFAALVLQGITGGFLGLAIAAISLGLVGNAALAERLGRNQRFASTGGVLATGLMGFIAFFCRTARYSSSPPRWCFRCSLLSAASSLPISILAAPPAFRITKGRGRPREPGSEAFARSRACTYSPAAGSYFSWPTRRCCHSPAKCSRTARKRLPHSSSQR
jgi:MFS family permease